jgi:archaellum biogenesis ATPase FlaH
MGYSNDNVKEAAALAANFLFAALRLLGLPEQVNAWIKLPGTPMAKAVVFTPETIDTVLAGVPDGSTIQVSPLSSLAPDAPVGVLIAAFRVTNVAENDEEKVLAAFRAAGPPIFDVADSVFIGDGRHPDPHDEDDTGFVRRGDVLLTGVAVAKATVSRQEYDAAHSTICKVFGGYPSIVDAANGYRLDVRAFKNVCAEVDLDTEENALFVNCDHVGTRSLAEIMTPAARFLAAGGDMAMFARLGRRSERENGQESIRWLVDGVIPMGTMTLLAGAQMTGKSTLATELAVAVAQDQGARMWLGRQIVAENATGLAVILSGEDSDGIINARLIALDPADTAARLVTYALDARTLPELAEALAKVPDLSLVIIDPARRYLVGDEDGSDSANSFFATLEALAAKTGAAVVVLHHLTKNAAPTSLQAVRTAVRGSGVWLDRPRVVLGVYRRQDMTMVGIAKHNIPPTFPMMTEGAFTRDQVTLRHVPVKAADTATDTMGEAEADGLEHKALAAITRLQAEGATVMRRGASELWALKPPELAGVGRDPIRRAVDALVQDGLVVAGETGLEVAE